MQKEWKLNGEDFQFDWTKSDDDGFNLEFEGKSYQGKVIKKINNHKVLVNFNGKNFIVLKSGNHISIGAKTIEALDLKARQKTKGADSSENEMNSPMPGKILKVLVSVGDEVKAGQGLLVMEAMKMEHTIKASHDGVVEDICFKEGELVDGGVELVKLKNEEEA